MDREFDVIVWGASGFTGRLVAEYLNERYGLGGSVAWAIAGRNQGKLDAVRQEIGAPGLSTILADGNDEASLAAMAERARVICTTVGPYALYGSRLVAACVSRGTHYCDLTGEVHWMRRMIDNHHLSAQQAGVRIVHTCGFDSIPSDIGVLCVQREMKSRHGEVATEVKSRVRGMRGGFSGGTVASMLNMMEESEMDPGVREVMNDPYGLNPAGERHGLDGPEHSVPEYDPDFGAWTTPFVMAAINTKVVRRSNALSGYAYGRDFRYDEAMLTGFGPWGFPLAAAMSVGSTAFNAAAEVSALRGLLARVLPEPGEGPSAAARERGFFDIEMLGKSRRSGARVKVRVRGDRDPGYGSTSRMLGESAVCLARDDLETPTGVLTPAVAMGEALIGRLGNNAGVTFEVMP